jgi:flagellar hook-associated protein 1 FlgK
MSISSAINTATAGLQATQSQIGIASQNIANVNTPGYIKRSQSTVSQSEAPGVSASAVSRILNTASLKQLRLETSGAAYTDLTANVASQVDSLFGVPGSSSSLDGLLNTYVQSVQTLSDDPRVSSMRTTVVNNAAALAGSLSTISDGIQALRTGMESQIGNDVKTADGLVKSIAALNVKIMAAKGLGGSPDLLDQRDQAINELSQYMDVQASEQTDGSVTVMTQSGLTLVEHGTATGLAFDTRASLTPQALYSPDAKNPSVGTIIAKTPGGAQIDLVAAGALRSGSIAAAVNARDVTLVQAQRQVDELAAGLAQSTTDRTVSAAGGTAIDISGLKSGNRITLSLDNGTQIALVASTTGSPKIQVGDVDSSSSLPLSFKLGTDADMATEIGTALGANYSVSISSGQLTISRTTANPTPAVKTVAASITVPANAADTKTGDTEFALFVDSGKSNALYTGDFDTGSQLTGFAQRIAINPAVKADNSALVVSSATTEASDPTRPQLVLNALTSTNRTFSAAAGIGGVKAPMTTNVADFARRVIDAQGANAAASQSLDEGQQIALSSARSRFAGESGVKIDEEMANLIQLQTAYGANARVLTAARDMLDTLMRI